ncbi:MAG: MFS transporter, partial [Ktedonobacterales bacterium]
LGIGAGLAFTSLSLLAMSGSTPEDSGLASGLLNTTTQVGAALGLAILATVATSRTGQLVTRGQSVAVALSGGYHLTWAISAAVVILSIALAATVLKSDPAGAGIGSMAKTDSAMEKEEICA